MINRLSQVTTYLETFAFNRNTGELIKRSHATGFFVKDGEEVSLITNWHVVTGCNPENPTELLGGFAPELLKIHVINKHSQVVNFCMPLYNKEINPFWKEHIEKNNVDVIALPLPKQLKNHFHILDIEDSMDNSKFEAVVGQDVFILGYPFSKEDLLESFGDNKYYNLAIWKRGSIASEPNLKISEKIILVDSMSRPGMSGSPVVISQIEDIIEFKSDKDKELLKAIKSGDKSGSSGLDLDNSEFKKVKQFNFLGIYSGVIGSTKLQEVALGKCWHKNILKDLLGNPIQGNSKHKPISLHANYLNELTKGLEIKNSHDEIVEEIKFCQRKTL